MLVNIKSTFICTCTLFIVIDDIFSDVILRIHFKNVLLSLFISRAELVEQEHSEDQHCKQEMNVSLISMNNQ